MRAVENGLDVIIISWFLDFFEEVPVNYTLVAQNLTTSAEPITISEIMDQQYLFRSPMILCNSYSFTVQAVTDAGNSEFSKPVIFRGNEIYFKMCTTKPESKFFILLL